MARNVYGLDLGSYDIKVYDKKKDTIWKEKNVIAFKDNRDRDIFAVGDDAFSMYGKAPSNIEITFPMEAGVISRFNDMQFLLQNLLKRGRQFSRGSEYVIAVPTDVTEVEKKAVEEATFAAGAREVHLIEEPVAAAIGAGIDISKPCGNMVVDIGGGTTDIAVISLGGSVVSTSIKVAGDKFDEYVSKYIKKKYNLAIGERTAEELKVNVGCVYPKIQDVEMDVRGRDLTTGLPTTVTIHSSEMLEALQEPALMIVDAVHSVLERTPPELAADISDKGIYMTGGGCLIDGLDKLLQEKTGINVMIAQDTVSCVALGTGKALDNLDSLDERARR